MTTPPNHDSSPLDTATSAYLNKRYLSYKKIVRQLKCPQVKKCEVWQSIDYLAYCSRAYARTAEFTARDLQAAMQAINKHKAENEALMRTIEAVAPPGKVYHKPTLVNGWQDLAPYAFTVVSCLTLAAFLYHKISQPEPKQAFKLPEEVKQHEGILSPHPQEAVNAQQMILFADPPDEDD